MPRRKWDHDVHRYIQVVFQNRKGGETVIWRCTLPNCQHYLVGEMVVGKLCLCNRCNDVEFEIKQAHLTLKKPHCVECTKGYKRKEKKIDISEIAQNLEDLLR